MKVLVTGANGMLGQDLCPVFEDAGMFVVQGTRENLDITNFTETENFIKNVMPQMIVNLAAYTNVDGAEIEPEKAYEVNFRAVENLAKLSKQTGALLIHISTDYVFDGTKETPYLPSDAPNPESIYGHSKFLGEEAVRKNAEKYYIARTSWLYGINGKNFIKTMINLGQDKDRELKVVCDQKGSPTYTVDLALGILKLLNKPYGTYHISGEGETTWYNFAKEIFNIENLHPNLIPVLTEEYVASQGAVLAPKPAADAQKTPYSAEGKKLIARGPKSSVLQNSVPMRHWMEALKDYLNYAKSLEIQ